MDIIITCDILSDSVKNALLLVTPFQLYAPLAAVLSMDTVMFPMNAGTQLCTKIHALEFTGGFYYH